MTIGFEDDLSVAHIGVVRSAGGGGSGHGGGARLVRARRRAVMRVQLRSSHAALSAPRAR